MYLPRLLLGAGLVLAGLYGLYHWRTAELSRESGYGLFMLAVAALLGGANFAATAFGLNLFGRDSGNEGASIDWDDAGGDGDND